MENENTRVTIRASQETLPSITFPPKEKGKFTKVFILDGQPPQDVWLNPDNTNLPNGIRVTLTQENYIEVKHGKARLRKRKNNGN